MYNFVSLLLALFVIGSLIFIMVKLNQMASSLAMIARASVAQQGQQTPQNQGAAAPPVKPHNLAGFGQSAAGKSP